MSYNMEIVDLLIKKGYSEFNKKYEFINFTNNADADKLLNDIERTPHAFVLACIMDRQITAERAWLVPFKIKKIIGSFEFNELTKYCENDYVHMFIEKKLHRFNELMAKNFYNAILEIKTKYNGEASNIWNDKPNSAAVVNRFLKFSGAGIKIASMAANILARQFKIELSDHHYIDVSPDVHVKRVFYRIGFIKNIENIDELLYCARELNPEYPGVFDLACWEIGKYYCRPKNPDCMKCMLEKNCPKIIN